ncbi:MAG: lipopolysaccharide kinase InaA family protein [Planctomycetota bacterium]
MPNFIRLHNKPYHWLINEAHQKFVQANFIGKEQVLEEEALKSPLKDNNARTLFSVSLPGQTELFIKRYKIDSLPRMLRNLVSSKAVNELRISNYLITKNCPTVYPIAVVQKKKWGMPIDTFLIMKKLPDMPTLGGYIENLNSRNEINEIVFLSGNLIRNIHSINLFHRDLHMGNILIHAGVEPKQLYIIDLHRASVLPGLSREQQIFNLAQFSYSMLGLLPSTNIMRFLKVYSSLDSRKIKLKALAYIVYERLVNIRHKHWQARNKRCFRNSSRYMAVKDGRKTFYVNRSYSGMADKLIDVLSGSELSGKVLKETAGHRLSVCNIVELADNFYIKEYRNYSFLGKVKSLLGYCPAKNNWIAADGLTIRGVLTADPVAFMIEKESFYDWVNTARIITKGIKGIPSNQYVIDNFSSSYAPAINHRASKMNKNNELKGYVSSEPLWRQLFIRKKEFIKDFALAVRRLHHKGVFHCDLKANNVIVKETADSVNYNRENPTNPRFPNWEFYFIDLDRVKFRQVLPWRERIKNLAQLNAAMPAVMTKSDRIRFFRYYAYGDVPVRTSREVRILAAIMRISIKRHHIWPG